MRQVRFLLKGKHQLSSTHPIENLVGFVEEEDIGKLVAAILAPSDNTTTYLGQTINGISELAKPTSWFNASRVSFLIFHRSINRQTQHS